MASASSSNARCALNAVSPATDEITSDSRNQEVATAPLARSDLSDGVHNCDGVLTRRRWFVIPPGERGGVLLGGVGDHSDSGVKRRQA